MRLLYVTATLPFGASEVFALPEIAALRRRGHEILVAPVRARGEIVHPEAREVLDERAATGIGGSVLATGLGAALRRPAWSAVGTMLRDPGSLPKNLAVLAKGLWVGRLAREWSADHIHAYWASTPATAAMVAARYARRPWSFTAHRWDIYEDNLLAEKAADAAFTRFISHHGLSEAAARGVPAGKASPVIHMGVEIPPVPAPRPGHAPFTLLCPASLIERKRHATVLEALSLLGGDSPRLLLAGDGPLRSALEERARRLCIEGRVDFLGQVTHGDLMALYRSGEVGATVLASESEGIPVALIEAMAFGVPVVATLVGGVPELLGDGAGLGVAVDDPRALARSIGRLAADPELAAALGDAGRRRIEEEYDVEKVAMQLEGLFAGAAGTGSHER